MTFTTLAVIGLAGCAGPLLAWPVRWHLPVVLGELLVGLLLGPTVFGALPAADPTFSFLAQLGFALVMFVAGSHVPVRDRQLRAGLVTGVQRAVVVGLVAAGFGAGIARLFGTGHGALYAVLISSSSAALVLPIRDSLKLTGPDVLTALSQVAVADTVGIVALPLAIDPAHASRAVLGTAAVLASAGVVFFVLRDLERRKLRLRLHKVSETRKFALELRINLVILFALAALAVRTHVSVLLAGFSFGLAVAGIGEPRRLARQLFAITEGFFGPLFFIWLGSSINLRDLGSHPGMIGLGFVLGLAAIGAHALARGFGQPLSLATLAAAQLGIPVAAATIGSQLHLLRPGEAAALLLGALITIAGATLGSVAAARRFGAGPATADAGELS